MTNGERRYRRSGERPASCGFDGPAYELELSSGEKLWDQGYACQDRADVGYLTSSLRPLGDRLEQMLLTNG